MWESHAFKIGADIFQFSMCKIHTPILHLGSGSECYKSIPTDKNQSMDLVTYCAMQGIMVEVHHHCYKYTLEQKGNLLKNCG